VLKQYRAVALPVGRGAGDAADMYLMEPLMTICIIGDATEVVKTDHSSGEVPEGLEEGEKGIGRSKG
jgi:hypothetical protein